VDVGSASVRAGLFDDAGNELEFATRPIKQFNPRPDFYEQSSADIWTQVVSAVRAAIRGVHSDDVRGIGFDATCSLVAVGGDGNPVSVAEDGDPQRDIIMWMDHRAIAEAADINATGDTTSEAKSASRWNCRRCCGCSATCRGAMPWFIVTSTWRIIWSGVQPVPT
jgi:ribulose kinase